MKDRIFVWLTMSCLAGLLTGCGTGKRLESTELPSGVSQGSSPSKAASSKGYSHYRVHRSDCLWTIAGKNDVYSDSFDWPLLFKANRDQIKDPDLIYPRQVLMVEPEPSLEEKAQAKKTAMATPKFVPHSKPRETLPVDYF